MSALKNCLRIEADNAGTKIAPIHASVQDLKNGKYCSSQAHGQPGVISNVKMSKTGKHGHAKFTFNLKFPFTGQTSQEMFPGHTHLSRPEMSKSEWMVTYCDGGDVFCLDDKDEEKTAYMDPDFEFNGDAIGAQFYEEFEEAQMKGEDFFVSILEGPVKDNKKDYFIRQIEKFCAKKAADN